MSIYALDWISALVAYLADRLRNSVHEATGFGRGLTEIVVTALLCLRRVGWSGTRDSTLQIRLFVANRSSCAGLSA